MAEKPDTIVLIHGLWMTPRSWEHWAERYESRGYKVLAPAWPGMEGEVEALNEDPSPIATLDVEQVVDHYEAIIRELESPPIIMGHSLGGTMTQLLLDRGLGAAGVGIASGTVKGVLDLPLSTLKASSPVLLNPFNRGKAIPLDEKQFHYAFANTLSQEESDAIYERYHVPAAATVLFEVAFANLHFHAPTKVNFENDDRAPMLFIGFERRPRRPVEREPAQRREVRGLAGDHGVQGVPGPAALPRRARLGGGSRLRPHLGRGEGDRAEAGRGRPRVIATDATGTELPELPLTAWEPTKDTLHLWAQIVGKVRMASSAPRNHWWHVPLYVGVRGLTTRRLHAPGGVTFEIDFDFVDHRLLITTNRGGHLVRPRRRTIGRGVRRKAPREPGRARHRRRHPRDAVQAARVDDAVPRRSRTRLLRPGCRRPLLAHPGVERRGARGVRRLVLRQDQPGAPLLARARPRADALRRAAGPGERGAGSRRPGDLLPRGRVVRLLGRAIRPSGSRPTTRTPPPSRRISAPAAEPCRGAWTDYGGGTLALLRTRPCVRRRTRRRRCSRSWRAPIGREPTRGLGSGRARIVLVPEPAPARHAPRGAIVSWRPPRPGVDAA